MATLLYAHWEGYAKAVFEAYLKLVLRRKPKVVEASEGLLLAHAAHLLRRVDSGDQDAKRELVELVRGGSGRRLRLVHSRVVDTRSNLRFEVLESIMEVLDVPIDGFTTKQKLIDVLLCDRRNEIAHGRANFPRPTEVLDLHDQVIEMMESMRDVVMGQVRTKAYRL